MNYIDFRENTEKKNVTVKFTKRNLGHMINHVISGNNNNNNKMIIIIKTRGNYGLIKYTENDDTKKIIFSSQTEPLPRK